MRRQSPAELAEDQRLRALTWEALGKEMFGAQAEFEQLQAKLVVLNSELGRRTELLLSGKDSS